MPHRKEIRRKLNVKRVELMGRLHRIAADAHRESAPLSQDFTEQAVERENDEVLDRIRESTQQEIALIDGALKRLEDGTYGICATCGQPIEAARLGARPEAETCITCAAKATRTKNSKEPARRHP